LFANLVDANQTGLTGDTLLHAAVIRGSSDDIDVLIRLGARINALGDLGNTPLHHAASRGLEEIAQQLLRYGADPNIKNEFGQTPLDLAFIMKRGKIADLLKRS
jgi:ankyrin repeat protein